MDFAERAHIQNYRMDPIIRTLADTDFYKFTMGQFIHARHFNDRVRFALTNRTKSERLADIIKIEELTEQLDHVRTLRFDKAFLIWLRGQTFFGQQGIFGKSFIDFLAAYQLPEFEISVDETTGQFIFETEARWAESTWWEIYVLSIISELRSRAFMRTLSKSQLRIMFARAEVKLYAKLERLRELEDLNLTCFATRRRFGHLWHEHCIVTAMEVLGDAFTGTSNAYFAMKHGLEAKGTNAHELPMVFAALADGDEELKQSPYKMLQQWQNMDHYREALLVLLPDTFGTTQFLADAPEWVRYWSGARPDSKDPIVAGEELIEFWKRLGEDPAKKLTLWADGLDVQIPGHKANGNDISVIHKHFAGRTRRGFGWGTMFGNDFIDCAPINPDRLKPISIVCKVQSANSRPAVKLSDNFAKATGPAEEVARYVGVFGTAGMANAPVRV